MLNRTGSDPKTSERGAFVPHAAPQARYPSIAASCIGRRQGGLEAALTNDRIQHLHQIVLLDRFVPLHDVADRVVAALWHRFRGIDEYRVALKAHVLPEDVKPLGDVRNPCSVGQELEAPLREKFEYCCLRRVQRLRRVAREHEIVFAADEIESRVADHRRAGLPFSDAIREPALRPVQNHVRQRRCDGPRLRGPTSSHTRGFGREHSLGLIHS